MWLETSTSIIAKAACSQPFNGWWNKGLRVQFVNYQPETATFTAEFNSTSFKKLVSRLMNVPLARASAVIRDRILQPLSETVDNPVANVLSADQDAHRSILVEERIHFPHSHSHCECILLAYFDRHVDEAEKLHGRYVGVSKLSCLPCHLVFKAHNLAQPLVKRHIYTRGSHDLVFVPWTVPKWIGHSSRAGAIRDLLRTNLHSLLRTLLRGKQSTRLQRASMSSAGSEGD